MQTLSIAPEWRERLGALGITDHSSFLALRAENAPAAAAREITCLSRHDDREMLRCTFTDDSVLFLKQIFRVSPEYLLKQLLSGRRPRVNTEYERRIFADLAQLGFAVPEVAAWGFAGVGGIQTSGTLAILPLNGISLEDYLKSERDPARRADAIARCEAALTRLQDNRYDWRRHCKPEHFFLMRGSEQVGLIDLESIFHRRFPLSAALRARQFTRFRSLLPEVPAGV